MDDKQLQKLIRQNAKRVEQARAARKKDPRQFDPTLPPQRSDEDNDRDHFFKEMKKREF